MVMTSFQDGMRVCIFGGSGGIGAALAEVLAADPRVSALCVGARDAGRILKGPKVTPFAFDLLDEGSIESAAADLKDSGSFDLIFIATGMLHDGEALQPEKSFTMQSAPAFAQAFAVNTTGPALIAKHFLPLLVRGSKGVFAALSARVGSISDNRLGGWHAYRASKAALNMLVRNFALELGYRNKTAIAVTLHPGTVATNLSAPFQSGVKPEQLFSPTVSVTHLLQVIDGLSTEHSGLALDWRGEVIAF
jgi:NAD(P)-dependent dehydrogenase (short-subunit alcohol dehydrogenase family)